MNARTSPTLALIALAALAAAPSRASALRLLDEELTLEPAQRPALEVSAKEAPAKQQPSLDFDLLGEPKPPPPVDDASALRRRKLLNAHQAIGIGLLGLELATTVTGQLNYNDKFGVDNTGRYKLTHKLLSYSTVGVFALNGAIALFAPEPKGMKRKGFDRTTIHALGMAVATVGMVTQAVLGPYTVSREGYLNQQKYGRAHLAVGYATLAAMSVAVGAIVF